MARKKLDLTTYSTVLFIDSMVVLEGKPLATMPWKEIDANGPVLVLLVPQVLDEVDKKKRDGRIGKRAREFNRLIWPAAESGNPARIVDGPPAVDLGIAVCGRPDWDALDDLDLERGDSRVVAQVLYVQDVPFEARVVFTQDPNVMAGASRHGLQTKRLPDHWMMDPEPSPAEKEIQRLKSRVKELEATEPELSVEIRLEGSPPVLSRFA